MSSDSPVVMPTARLTIEYGLDKDGNGIMAECWENLSDPDSGVDMVTKAGMLTMAQQSLTYLALGLDEDDDDE